MTDKVKVDLLGLQSEGQIEELKKKRNGKDFNLKKVASNRLLGKKNSIRSWFYSEDGNHVYIIGYNGSFICKLSLDYKGFGAIFELLRRNKDKQAKYGEDMVECINQIWKDCHETSEVITGNDKVKTFLGTRKDEAWDYPVYQMAFLNEDSDVFFGIAKGFLFVVDSLYDQYIAVGALRK